MNKGILLNVTTAVNLRQQAYADVIIFCLCDDSNFWQITENESIDTVSFGVIHSFSVGKRK